MAGETIITVVGNLTADPELRYTQNGLAVANFTIASTPRTFDRQANEWKDGEALFLRASVWREFAEHVAGSLTKGSRVIASGRLKQRSYETKEGEKRTTIELEVDEIGPSLRYATASVTRAVQPWCRRRQQLLRGRRRCRRAVGTQRSRSSSPSGRRRRWRRLEHPRYELRRRDPLLGPACSTGAEAGERMPQASARSNRFQ
jgi:single-strand DNA-binding protein